MASVVTLLTDFGDRDHYVASMKGRILKRNPDCKIIDVSHNVPRHDIRTAAFLLGNYWREFPSDTVHICVVDPGVGSERLSIAADIAGRIFVGPDNGLITFLWDLYDKCRVRQIQRSNLFDNPVSDTFHGRDIYAPAGASIAGGFLFDQVGPLVEEPVLLDFSHASIKDRTIEGEIVHVDIFGNAISNIKKKHIEVLNLNPIDLKLSSGVHEVANCVTHYGDLGNAPGILFGSSGYLEVALKNESAAKKFRMKPGDKVIVESK